MKNNTFTQLHKSKVAWCAAMIFVVLGMNISAASAQNCMMKPVSLQQRINNTTAIVEGGVISKESFWNTAKTMIFTQYTVKVYKWFKGAAHDPFITIVNEGGQVGDNLIVLNPNLELNVGDIGIFDLIENNLVNDITFQSHAYTTYAGGQSFIRYDKEMSRIQGVYDSYADISTLYQKITDITHEEFVERSPFPAAENISPKPKAGKALVITNVSPLTVTAGTYTEITITGSGFGATPTQVWFHDADNTPNGIISPPSSCNLIVSWSDTQIKTWVPSGATDGTIYVKDQGGVLNGSTQSLTVPYNITNMYLSSGGGPYKSYTFDLVNSNSNGGYTATFNNNFYANTNAVARFQYGMELWRCATGVNWTTNGASTTTVGTSLSDGINVISFDNTVALPAGVLGRASSYYEACQSGAEYYRTLKEFDIIFNHTINWNFLNANPATDEYDFQSVSIHEIGHLLQQGHYGALGDVMHWSLDSGMTARTLRPGYEVLGANYILSRNNPTEITATGSTGGSTVANPCGPGPMTLNFANCTGTDVPENELSDAEVRLLPNPFNESATLSFQREGSEPLKLAIYSPTGQLMQLTENITGQSCRIARKNLGSGIYFYKLFSDTRMVATGKLMID